MARVFIAYRRDDSEDVTARIHDALARHVGAAETFRDVDDIPLGVRFSEYLQGALQECRVFIAVIGKHWVSPRLHSEDDHLRREIEYALNHRLSVIPVLVHGARIPPVVDIPATLMGLTEYQATEVTSGKAFAANVEYLAKHVKRLLDVPLTGASGARSGAENSRGDGGFAGFAFVPKASREGVRVTQAPGGAAGVRGGVGPSRSLGPLLKISKAALATLEGVALAGYARGEMACGYLTGPEVYPGLVDHAVELENLATKYHRIDPESHPRDGRNYFKVNALLLERALAGGAAGRRPVKAFFYSQLDCGANLSKETVSSGVVDGRPTHDLDYLVIAVEHGQVTDTKLFVWSWGARQFVESEYSIVD